MTLDPQLSDGSAGAHQYQESDGMSFRIMGTKKQQVVQVKKEMLKTPNNTNSNRRKATQRARCEHPSHTGKRRAGPVSSLAFVSEEGWQNG